MVIVLIVIIVNIIGVLQLIELIYQNLYVKLNFFGEFIVINFYLVCDFKVCGLWDLVMVNDLKYYDGFVQQIECILQDFKDFYVIVFEVEICWIVEVVSCCQKWIDQVQLLNLYIVGVLGKKFDVIYCMVWFCGLKIIYYFCVLVVISIEKFIINIGKFNVVLVGGNDGL